MHAWDHYRAKAAELFAQANSQTGPLLRAGFEDMARGYLLLANQAEKIGLPILLTSRRAKRLAPPQPKRRPPSRNRVLPALAKDSGADHAAR